MKWLLGKVLADRHMLGRTKAGNSAISIKSLLRHLPFEPRDTGSRFHRDTMNLGSRVRGCVLYMDVHLRKAPEKVRCPRLPVVPQFSSSIPHEMLFTS